MQIQDWRDLTDEDIINLDAKTQNELGGKITTEVLDVITPLFKNMPVFTTSVLSCITAHMVEMLALAPDDSQLT